ncbi:acylneuraminate cytidylyltransferase family protein [Idiomarina zobellii]|uniref:CMP-sialic acid synthetase n=1 Tax=Idiomarina zobellii TaxID=86103 RepID=A0A837NH19_9GAMM|nr:acylneuraminate cytidylyltransferase family protein [Idiomarina zobellii]KPD21776.1 CMP-sialic acid synthetase [Idiomarina zobellii]SDG25833.1 CMP-N-acetylneuraminic acid synthetase [Idiomarina zobellii]
MNVALITARGGSKGLPGKNIALLNGKPLIVWTILAAQKAASVDAVYVSTEDQAIAKVSQQAGVQVIPRPAELAQDDTSSEPVIAHAINYLKKQPLNVTSVTLLQPTSPLRSAQHIDEAYRIYANSDANCVLSVIEPAHSAAKAYKLNSDGSLSGLLSLDAPYMRRQDLPRTVHPNGAIYIFSTAAFEAGGGIPRQNVYPYIMSEEASVDIDRASDLQLAEQIMERMQYG